jgi:ribosomal-protein-alanine N-acetyltransferase
VFGDPVVLRTTRLILHQITESDGGGLFDIFGDSQVTEHYAWDTFTSLDQGPRAGGQTAGQFRQGEALRWGLLPHGGAQIIGTCGYTRWNHDNHFAVIGYDLASRHWRQGLMTEAVTAVLHYGYEQMELNRVEATVLTGNTASIALLKRIGFQHEGELRKRVLHRGRYHNVHIFGLTRSDWVANTRDPLLPLADRQVL